MLQLLRFEVLGLGLTGLAIAGPNARALLQPLTDTDLSPEAFRFMDVRRIDVGMVPVIAARVSYSGELGWELWVAPHYQRALFDLLMERGAAHGIRQKFIKPHCPWQNGKVERFNRTLATEWAYRQNFTSNDQRSAALAPWLEHYNTERRHSALGGLPPVSRLPT